MENDVMLGRISELILEDKMTFYLHKMACHKASKMEK